jgi:hypothetical protein
MAAVNITHSCKWKDAPGRSQCHIQENGQVELRRGSIPRMFASGKGRLVALRLQIGIASEGRLNQRANSK